jgi:hypothetical protein
MGRIDITHLKLAAEALKSAAAMVKDAEYLAEQIENGGQFESAYRESIENCLKSAGINVGSAYALIRRFREASSKARRLG